MLSAIIIGVLISLAMLLLRAVLGSTSFDRMLSANSMGTHAIVIIVLLGIFKDSALFIDIALIYALISFVSTVAFLMYSKYRQEEDKG